MITNLHTHTTFCDGKNSAEEVVLTAIKEGAEAIGFSGHCYTEFDLRYCMKDEEGYKAEITALKQKYKGVIDIYLGLEEDCNAIKDTSEYDFIIGSCHYCKIGQNYYAVDNVMAIDETLKAVNFDFLQLAEIYYSNFTSYILNKKPDVVGHFDVISKFDEIENTPYKDNVKYIDIISGACKSSEYRQIAKKYLLKALESGCIFEVNTGTMARGYRTHPFPSKELLEIIYNNNGKIMLSADSHSANTLNYAFSETIKELKEIGFKSVYTLKKGEFIKMEI